MEDCEDCLGRSGPSLLLLLPVLVSVAWAAFQLLYGSWLLAFLITKVVNAFLKDSGIYIGSIHLNLLTRRIVFKHFHYYCRDYSMRVVSGYAGVGVCKTCCSCSSAKALQQSASMFVQLEGMEYHWYNRSEAYDGYGRTQELEVSPPMVEESGFWVWWKNNQPSLHFSITKGQLVLGNHMVERSLVIHFAKAEAHYCTVEASTPFDELLHRVDVEGTHVTVAMECSHGYSGPVTPHPPGSDEGGYQLLQTDSVHCVFSEDSPGLMPLGKTAPPKYEFCATLGSNTVITYGTYANNLRRLLQFSIFPNDHVEQVVSREVQPGERRVHSMFDIAVTLSSPAKFVIPFTWQESLHSLTVSLGQQSHLEIHAPWLTEQTGSKYTIQGELQEVGVTSSLPYPELASAGSVGYEVTLDFPRLWNGVQKWRMNFTGQRAQVNILFAYIDFVNGLLDDWVGSEPNDLLDFVPVDWTVSVDLEQYEIYLLTNRYNWLDLSSGGVENTRLAFCGASGQISLKLPFTKFNPLEQLVQFSAKGQDLVVRHYATPSSIARDSMFALSAANRYRWRVLDPPPAATPPPQPEPPRQSGSSQPQSTSSTVLQSGSSYSSHVPVSSQVSSNSETDREQTRLLISAPQECPPQDHIISAPIIGEAIPLQVLTRPVATPTPDPMTPVITAQSATPVTGEHLEAKELFPMGCRLETLYERGWLDLACGPSITIDIEYRGRHHDTSQGFCTPLIPSSLHVDIDAPQALVRVFGCLGRDLLSLKENYPGEYIKMTPFRSNVPDAPPTAQDIILPPLSEAPAADSYEGSHAPQERTVDITVSFKLRNILAEFPVDVGRVCPRDFPLPSLCTDVLRVDVDYSASDTTVRLHVDPLSVHVPSLEEDMPTSVVTRQLGHVVINSIDLNCHGFTEYLCRERVEYAWMMQLQVGRITGAVSPMQLLHAADWFLTTITHIVAIGDSLAEAPDGDIICPRVEPISEEIKYRLFQLELCEADVHVCEGASITRLQSCGLDLDFCSLHHSGETLGMSWQLHSLTVTGCLPAPQNPAVLLQVGLLDVGGVTGGVALSEPKECVVDRQRDFLHLADGRSRRLRFLWEDGPDVCGCCGGCVFLGGAISRRSLCAHDDSAVYGPQFTPLQVVPRHLGISALASALKESSMKDVSCLWNVHRSLLDHYNLRYAGHQSSKLARDSRSKDSKTRDSPSSFRCSDSEIFHSARSSLASDMWLDDDVVSVKEVGKRKTHHRKTSQLSSDVRAAAMEEVDAGGSVQEEYNELVPSSYLHSATFYISTATPTTPEEREESEGQHGAGLEHSQPVRVEPRPQLEEPIRPTQSPAEQVQSFQLYVPCLQHHSDGSVPRIAHKPLLHSLSTLERRRYAQSMTTGQQSQSDHTPKFSLSINICGENILRLSPLFVDILESVVQSVKRFVDNRSAMSILNTTSFSTAFSISNLISQDKVGQPGSSDKVGVASPGPSAGVAPSGVSDEAGMAPFIGLHISMSTPAFIAVQFLQHSPTRRMSPGNQWSNSLQEIVPHRSLLTVYMSGASVHMLLSKSCSPAPPSSQGNSPAPPTDKVSSPAPPTNQVTSMHVAVRGRCPVLQLNLSALVPVDHSCSLLPGLAMAQQQLDFVLMPPQSHKLCFALHDLLEVGLKDLSVSVAASFVTSKVQSRAVLSWDQVVEGGCYLETGGEGGDQQSSEEMNNVLGIKFNVGSLWSQLAAPKCGLAHPSSGGLDLLIVLEAIEVWKDKVPDLLTCVSELLQIKAHRDKTVLLTLISLAARCQCLSQPFSPVLHREATAYRKTVWFSCMQHLCRALCFSTEVSVPSAVEHQELDVLLVAAMLALASKLYCQRGTEAAQDLVLSGRLRTHSTTDRLSIPNTGYVSVSPSPSDLAVPNCQYGYDMDEDVDVPALFSTLTTPTLKLLRETLLSFFSAAGVHLKEQLHESFPVKNQFKLDFSLEMREATLFVLEYLAPPSDPTYLHTRSTAATPALFMEQLLFQGNLEHNAELSANSAQHNRLLPKVDHTHPATKVGVVSNCCMSLVDVRVVVNAPLLKVAKHISGTGKLRRQLQKQARMCAADSQSTPRPAASTTPSRQQADFTLPKPTTASGYVTKFATSATREILTLEGSMGGEPSHAHTSGGSSPASHLHLVTYPSSPHPPAPVTDPQDHTLPIPSCTSVLDSSTGLAQSSSHPSHYSSHYSSHCSSTELTSDEDTTYPRQRQRNDVSVTMEDGTSPEEVPSTMDTCGEDTTDSAHMLSSDNDELQAKSVPRRISAGHTSGTTKPDISHQQTTEQEQPGKKALTTRRGMAEGRGLYLPRENLSFSVFVLLKCQQISCEVQIETTRATLALTGISAAMDTRNSTTVGPGCDQRAPDSSFPQLSLLSELLPTYLSTSVTLKKAQLKVNDKGLSDYDVLYLELLPMYISIGMNNCRPLVPVYRCLLKLSAVNVEMKQSAVKVHKRFQQLMPSFTNIYNDIFGKEVAVIKEMDLTAPPTSSQGLSLETVMKLPSKMPVGLVHLGLDKAAIYVAPLPSLVLTYNLAPVNIKAETGVVVNFQLVVGEHLLRFTPKEQFKNELSLRSLTLPYLCFQGNLRRSKKKKLPQLNVDLFVKKLNIDLTTDVLNQLLVVQNTFIKEVNDLLQMLTSIGEALPHRDRLPGLAQRSRNIVAGPAGGGGGIISVLESCRLSLAGIMVTVSTPLATAIRFSTGKIELTLTNTSSQAWQWPQLPANNQLSLDGRVDIDINLALGYLKPVPPDVVDDLCELAYFRTKVSIRNTLQNLYSTDERHQNLDHLDQDRRPSGGDDTGTAVDTFLISIASPHLYLQSSAVEQAILFWLNCKSVYSYWQNEKKQLNVEVQKATEAFMEKINRPNRAPSIDFSKPRLVQISVSDMGACMPIIPVSSSEHSMQRQFPAIVVTIKEMQFLLNLSEKVASTGRFQTFCVRFSEQFSLRQRIWTLDPKKFKITNYGTITRGTFRLCIATKKRYSDKEPTVAVGEKLLSAFQWDMSGININANTDVGHHISTLVRTMTTIASGLEDSEEKRKTKSKVVVGSVHSPKTQVSKQRRHRRSSSLHRPSQVDTQYKIALEQELARQTSKVQKMKLAGAAVDSVRTEEAILRSTQQELSKTVHRMFRHPRSGISLQNINQIFFKTPDAGRKSSVRTRLFSVTEEPEGRRVRGTSPVTTTAVSQRAARRGHRRHVSDLTGMRGVSPTRTPTPPIQGHRDQEEEDEEEEEEEEEGDDDAVAAAEPAEVEETEAGKPTQDGFSLPSIDLEFDVTVNVDHGKVVLRTEENASVVEWRHLHSSAMSSPFTRTRKMSSEHKHYVESVLLIPALTVRAHYHSIVGRSYLNSTSPYLPSSPQKVASPPPPAEPATPTSGYIPEEEPLPSLPVKRGVLSLHAVVESLPEHIKLTPSLLNFIEQVAQPTLAAAAVSSSSSTESISNEEEDTVKEGEEKTSSSTSSSSPLSFPVDVILAFHIQPSTVYLTCQPHSQVECTIQSPNVNFVISFSLFSHQLSDGPVSVDTSSPTPSMTGSNAKVVPFNNLYVTGCLSTFVLQLYSLKPGGVSVSDNREALSLTLGQALFHLSRKSVAAPTLMKNKMTTATSVDDYQTHNKLQVSVIMNVASLVLGHDMRRLNDITAFRRYWYRTSLVEAIFIGKKEMEKEVNAGVGVAGSSDSSDGGAEDAVSGAVNLDNSISAAIVVAANVEDFRVSANVAQVMGNADLLVSHLKCLSHCDVSHNELVLFQLAGKLVKGEFDARAGVIAGSVLMENANVFVLTQSQQGCTPEHVATASLSLAQGKVDYMGLCILLARATELKIRINDLWEGLQLGKDVAEEEEEELASIQIKTHFTWQDLQVAIHRSTTQHLFNIAEKLYDFIMQQRRRSERTLGNMLPAGSAAKRALQAYRKEQERIATTVIRDSRHHWLWAVRVWSMELMEVLGICPPRDAHHEVSLGGTIGLSGDSLCISCFHGPSFRETERAVFNIDGISASFSTQAIPGLGRWHTKALTHLRTCQQIVKVSLDSQGGSGHALASIHRVSTGKASVPNITNSTNIKEWLAYACIDAILHQDKFSTDSSTLVRLCRKLTVQQVLLVPTFSMTLINDHFWPLKDDGTPKVECTLTSSFSDSISVTTTVDHYLFLHDLVKGYIDYLEKHRLKPAVFLTKVETGSQVVDDGSSLPHRQYECVCWELNPHLCLLTTVRGQFNPHISWLLEKLGFQQATTTIPKSLQRGAMDPLDKVISMAVELLVKLTASKKKNLLLIQTSVVSASP